MIEQVDVRRCTWSSPWLSGRLIFEPLLSPIFVLLLPLSRSLDTLPRWNPSRSLVPLRSCPPGSGEIVWPLPRVKLANHSARSRHFSILSDHPLALPGHETITTTAQSLVLIPRLDALFSHLFVLVIHGPVAGPFLSAINLNYPPLS
ncbi:uncharacterized protein BO80DRAFT_182324 [Aspergillus ibericus CBS 121593]|uniref:Uncharacterized protein n=1 Tax=Aspergillus ibericus CBS 121593 TaxID=1448316 RepID=A0A395GRI4_9EURO|nr:hypothetical protein BO80DRAFT_182324 [Aspergillus ibericus CBS 121593]RAK97834.1 hypothetical protein BO80DRAFT_182324 [Aspergillus ibericus CBS 121593]